LKEEKIENIEKIKSDYRKKNAPLLNDCKEMEDEVAEQNKNEILWQMTGNHPRDTPVFNNNSPMHDSKFDSDGATDNRSKIFVTAFMRAKDLT
jgi:hypothetical protein